MKKDTSDRLGSLFNDHTPLHQLPIRVLMQLVGYYGNWRRARDILTRELEEDRSTMFSGRLLSEHYPSNHYPAQ